MWPLRQSTASQEIPLGPFLDKTDGNTQETGLTIANTDIKLLKGGATSEVSKNSGGGTHIANGRYYAVIDATDSDTLGPMRVSVHHTEALAVWLDCIVYPAEVYDALFAGSGNGIRADVRTILGQAPTLSSDNRLKVDVAEFNDVPLSTTNPLPNAAPGSGSGLATATNVSAVETDTQDIQSTLASRLVGTIATGTHNPQSGDAFSRIGAAGAGLTDLGGMSTTMKGQVQAEAEDAIVAKGLVIASGTIGSTGNDTTHLHLAGIAWADNSPNHQLLVIQDVSTGLKYTAWIEDWANTGDLATVATLPFTPEASVDLFWVLPFRDDVEASSSVTLAPIVGHPPQRQAEADVQLYYREVHAQTVDIVDRNGDPVDLTGYTKLRIERPDRTEVQTTDATIGGTGNGSFTWTPSAAVTLTPNQTLPYSLYHPTTFERKAFGHIKVDYKPVVPHS